ncbi:dienelactone hydrolase family protein [uncultured Pigmentiphaga sp.]|uniref:dienelactone hydrolase family protein n=1 Tax=uncultured Pigmentiphaga sp. TaxID=340361 RepID=UPI00261A2276|nr:dienelactone hydrolase family protein [uncultured Pigmentiphaga sp.]
MQTGSTNIDAGDGRQFHAYASLPAQPNGHAVIILQEIFGVTAAIRALADKYAAAGYLALAPDLFWRLEPGVELSHSKDDLERAFGYLQRFDEAAGLDDIGRTAEHIRAQPGFTGGVAAVGLCLGGKLAFRAAAGLDIDAAAVFYGVGVEDHLGEAPTCPIILHYGDQDRYASADAQARIEAALRERADATFYRYPGAGHGFYTRGATDAAALAHERTVAFLHSVLRAGQR